MMIIIMIMMMMMAWNPVNDKRERRGFYLYLG